MTRRDDVDVCVVGAGLAGLTCARELVRAGRSVVVYEARDRVGGRTENARIGDGKTIDVGGQWIGPTQDELAALADDYGIDTFATHTAGESVLCLLGERHTFEGEFPPFPEKTLTDIVVAIGALEEMAAAIRPEAPWEAPEAAAWDAVTFQSWIDATVSDPGAKAMLDLVSGAVLTAAPAELSLLHVLFYIRSAGNLSPMLTDVEGGAQERRFVGGSVRISEAMASELGDLVRTSVPARRIEASPNGVVLEADGAEARCRRVVVAVPPTVCDLITFEPALPGRRAQLQRRLAAGSVIKCNLVYDEPFWRDQGLSGRVVDPDGPVTISFDNSPPDGSPGILLAFLEADHARRLGELEAGERQRVVREDLARHFGPRAAAPELFVERLWDDERWTRGCYGANLPPGGWTRYGPAMREPVGAIHWASAETSPIWANYMDGAVRSGKRAAAEVLDVLP